MNILPLSTLVPLKKYFVKDRAGKSIWITSLNLSSNAEFDDLQFEIVWITVELLGAYKTIDTLRISNQEVDLWKYELGKVTTNHEM